MHVFIKAANHAALLLPERTKSAGQATLGKQIFEAAFSDQPELLQGSDGHYCGTIPFLIGSWFFFRRLRLWLQLLKKVGFRPFRILKSL